MEKKRVLLIGQLPKESGGTYTTGIARVVENLYQKVFGDFECYWYFTNVPAKVADAKSNFPHQYTGYSIMPIRMLWNMVAHPFRTIDEWKQYRMSGVSSLRFEFYKANLKKCIEAVKPDLIHLHGAGLPPLYFANRERKAPIVLTFHGVMYNERDQKSWRFKPIYQQQLEMADYYTVLNQETKRKAMLLGMPENKSSTIPNGVDVSHFYFSEKHRKEVREMMQVGIETKVFITVGAVIDRKGQYDFLQVLEMLGINYQYWIVGKGPDEQRIVEYVSKHHLEDRVKLLGYKDGNELYKYHSAADFYAHVSTTEGQALSEIEAYATGLRVIVRREIMGTVIGDAESDNNTYYVLDIPNANADILKEWLKKDIGKRESKGKYDWCEIARQYSELYSRILS